MWRTLKWRKEGNPDEERDEGQMTSVTVGNKENGEKGRECQREHRGNVITLTL